MIYVSPAQMEQIRLFERKYLRLSINKDKIENERNEIRYSIKKFMVIAKFKEFINLW